ncbi:dUTP diphosphatase [Candidatus Nomurabacteria bacterium CG_4_10_14_0_2_um_filter_30_12]|uniref:dUTP diphosphatase n=1 Tax=Candidatus Nomurabacteria bacterium CG_4_10_14_0_2_um_filter_30_12 TaxID=1974727 RepID=A0A2J0MF38_9BACT|nr:MAG: dUTP diphosphatase [Candidatus Nomurabacteria bacterium CG_4_10_14_0_2_um_filter_30_12]
MKIKIKKLKKDAKLPTYHHPGDVGMDLYSLEEYTVAPGEKHYFYHGFALEFPLGYAAIIKDKSSISKAGLHSMGGVFDAGFRGEYNTLLVNLSNEPYTIEIGDKVAQLVIFPVIIAELEETEELSDSSRGVDGFGSTGRK